MLLFPPVPLFVKMSVPAKSNIIIQENAIAMLNRHESLFVRSVTPVQRVASKAAEARRMRGLPWELAADCAPAVVPRRRCAKCVGPKGTYLGFLREPGG